jgi:hypothetical protein
MAWFVLALMAVTLIVTSMMLVYPKIRVRNEERREVKKAMKDLDKEYEDLFRR